MNTLCPYCREVVGTYSPDEGGTVTDEHETRWHHSCFVKSNEEDKANGMESRSTHEIGKDDNLPVRKSVGWHRPLNFDYYSKKKKKK